VDAYRIRKETLKARLTAAQAEASVYTGLAELDLAEGDGGSQDEDLGALAASARERLTEIEQEVQRVTSAVGKAEGRPGQAPAPGLMELRAGTPGDGEVRIVLAIEPPGTVLLIAVLEGSQAWREHYEQAIALSSEVLLSVRDGEAPEAAARQYDGPREFLAEFFPADAGRIEAAAASLAARNRGRSLAAQRERLGLTQAQVAGRMGITEDQVADIERAEAGATEVGVLGRYVEALGGRLEIVADFGEDRVLLR
jgi:DNA-binding XRE family transcriptional regulator